MSRLIYTVLAVGFGGLILHAIFTHEPDDPMTVAFKEAGYDRWVYGCLIASIVLAVIVFVRAMRQTMRRQARARHMATLKGPELVKYLIETGWPKKW